MALELFFHHSMKNGELGMVGPFVGQIPHTFTSLFRQEESGFFAVLVCDFHYLLVFGKVVFLHKGGPGFFILVGEVVFPAWAEVDVPTPEAAYQGFWIIVVLGPEGAGLTAVRLLCHNKNDSSFCKNSNSFRHNTKRAGMVC